MNIIRLLFGLTIILLAACTPHKAFRDRLLRAGVDPRAPVGEVVDVPEDLVVRAEPVETISMNALQLPRVISKGDTLVGETWLPRTLTTRDLKVEWSKDRNKVFVRGSAQWNDAATNVSGDIGFALAGRWDSDAGITDLVSINSEMKGQDAAVELRGRIFCVETDEEGLCSTVVVEIFARTKGMIFSGQIEKIVSDKVTHQPYTPPADGSDEEAINDELEGFDQDLEVVGSDEEDLDALFKEKSIDKSEDEITELEPPLGPVKPSPAKPTLPKPAAEDKELRDALDQVDVEPAAPTNKMPPPKKREDQKPRPPVIGPLPRPLLPTKPVAPMPTTERGDGAQKTPMPLPSRVATPVKSPVPILVPSPRPGPVISPVPAPSRVPTPPAVSPAPVVSPSPSPSPVPSLSPVPVPVITPVKPPPAVGNTPPNGSQKPVEQKPVEPKPVVTKPVETKPVLTPPVVTPPVVNPPSAVTPPAAKPPVVTTPVATQPRTTPSPALTPTPRITPIPTFNPSPLPSVPAPSSPSSPKTPPLPPLSPPTVPEPPELPKADQPVPSPGGVAPTPPVSNGGTQSPDQTVIDKKFADQSVGAHFRGSLRNPSNLKAIVDKLAERSRIRVVHPEQRRYFGNYATAEFLVKSSVLLDRLDPGHILEVGDISAERGGHLRPHKSHQNGLDIDVGFLFEGKKKNYYGSYAANGNTLVPGFARSLHWKFFKSLMTYYHDKIYFILVHPAVKQGMCEEAVKSGDIVKGKPIDPIIQHTLRRLVPERSHNSHFHVRLRCPTKDKRCLQTKRDLAPTMGCFARKG